MTVIAYPIKPGYVYDNPSRHEAINCSECGVPFGAPASFFDQRRRDRRTFYCPNGHPQWFPGDTAEKKLERERARAGRLAAERDQAIASARAEKAAKTRFKNQRDRDRARVSNGVCPCCNRTFKQLARHMASQHPDWPAESEA